MFFGPGKQIKEMKVYDGCKVLFQFELFTLIQMFWMYAHKLEKKSGFISEMFENNKVYGVCWGGDQFRNRFLQN